MKELSDCCGAEAFVYEADEGTCCYICKKCNKPCDIKVDKEEVEKEENPFDVTDKSKQMLVSYISNNKIADFGKISTYVKLSMCQNVKQWQGKHSVISKRSIGKKKVGKIWQEINVPYLKHQVSRKFLNFCFNFKISVRAIGEDKFSQYEEEYEKWDWVEEGGQKSKKKVTDTRIIFEATLVREYSFTDNNGNIFVRPVRASAKAYKNPATSMYSVIESAESKTWTKVAKTFGIGDDLAEDESRAYTRANKSQEENRSAKKEETKSKNHGY